VPGVAGAARSVYGKALLSTPSGAAAATLKGIVPAEERTVTEVVSKLVAGSAAALGEPGGDAPPPILLGTALADSLNVGVGDVVTIPRRGGCRRSGCR
jgi:lipoprotein-releasing system permease protein